MSKRINFEVSEEEHKKIKMEALKNDLSIKDFFMLAVNKKRNNSFDNAKKRSKI